MSAIKHDHFYAKYKSLINTIFEKLLPRFEQITPPDDLYDLQVELLSREAELEIMRVLSVKSIRENAALVVLAGEYEHVTKRIQESQPGGRHNDEDLAAMADEALGSTKEILEDLPSWMKASLKVLQELLKMSISGRRFWRRRKKKKRD